MPTFEVSCDYLIIFFWRFFLTYCFSSVNYQFALNAARNSRLQDFIWIHDYHLMLVGLILDSLEPKLEVGFFLHIPFQLSADFFQRYPPVGEAILRGLLKFTKVGFQTHRDRHRFLELVDEHLPMAKIKRNTNLDTITVTMNGGSSSYGVFPVSIKNEEFLLLVDDDTVINNANEVRQKYIGSRDGKLLFSVERFDYTKGIQEKILAYQKYLEAHPERHGKDVFLQAR